MAAPMLINFRSNFRLFLLYSSRIARVNRVTANGNDVIQLLAHNQEVTTALARSIHVGSCLLREKSDDPSSSSSDSSDEDATVEEVKLSAVPEDRKQRRRVHNQVHQENLAKQKVEPFSVRIAKAAEDVSRLTADPDETVNDLLRQLQIDKSTDKKTDDPLSSTKSIGDLLSGMVTEATPTQKTGAKPVFDSDVEDISSLPRQQNIFTGARLNIFDPSIMNQPPQKSATPFMDKLRQEELEAMANFPPSNAFQEMIQWTKQGKMWHFPIDNEQGLDEEKNTPFTEHVFLDHLIEDFPKKGPIRHFMELVAVGLSKNPYLTVEEKHNQIQWFRDYFKDKMHLVEFEDNHAKLSGS